MKMHKSITEERIVAAAEQALFGTEDIGFCVACGEDAYGVESDAERYPCDICGEPHTVYGSTALLIRTVA